jgi:DNA-directed RNA polymerase specialized sigma24 family protein
MDETATCEKSDEGSGPMKTRYSEFDSFYRACWDEVYRPMAGTLRNPDLAAEAVDEAMIRAYRRWRSVRDYHNQAGWVYRVGLNWAVSQLRKTRRETHTIVAFLAVTGAIALRGGSSSVVGDGGRIVFEDGYALTPAETTTLLVECLQERGLDVTESSGGINYDNRNVARSDVEAGVSACEAELRGAGFLLPGDNPENLTVLYLQFEALAECYRSAGIPTSDPPTVDEFIDARQAGIPTWSPQTEAIQHSGVDATTRAEQNCDIPTTEQFRVDD